jgi:hypothetical protein
VCKENYQSNIQGTTRRETIEGKETMRIIYASKTSSYGEPFYYEERGYNMTFIILPSDLKYIDGVESKSVRKIIKVTYQVLKNVEKKTLRVEDESTNL